MSLLPSRPAGERTTIMIINPHVGDVLSASGDTSVVFSSFGGANAQRRVIKGNFSKQIKTPVFSLSALIMSFSLKLALVSCQQRLLLKSVDRCNNAELVCPLKALITLLIFGNLSPLIYS